MLLPVPIDIAAINTAIVLAVGGLVVHWIRRVNKMFVAWELMQVKLESKINVLQVEFKESERVNDQVWEDVDRRLQRLEGNGRWHGR